jgi:maltooligosyltrehalose trehalohydrolase
VTVISVWAPRAAEVALDVGGQLLPVAAEPGRPGWYRSERDLEHGTDYFVLVDGQPVPDPRARWSPHGVHGRSRVLDTSTFSWGDQGWTGAALDGRSLVYELHVGTFTAAGTLIAAAEHLPHLAALGVTHIELLPLAAFDGDRGWGYDGVQFNAVHEPYGGPYALAGFVDSAHAAGIAVLLDVVHNHLGPSGNYWDLLAPIVTDSHHTPWGGAINLDGPGSDDVRAILVDSALGWLRDFHLDGLRLDAVHELHDRRPTPYLKELSESVAALAAQSGRPLALVADSDRNDPRTVTDAAAGGLGMTAQWDDDVHHALHWVLTDERDGYYGDFADCSAAAYALENAFLHDGRWSSFRARVHGRRVDFDRTPPGRFVVALQTHDQVGNRANGDRLCQLVRADSAAAGAALLFALPYVLMLFMGEEWGARTPWCFFCGFDDPEMARAVTKGRREEFARHGWPTGQLPDPQDVGTFVRSTLDWSELDSCDSQRMLSWYRLLSELHGRRSGSARPPRVFWQQDPRGRPRWWGVLVDGTFTVVNLDAADRVSIDLQALPGVGIQVAAAWTDEYWTRAAGVGAPDRTAVVLGPGQSLVVEGVQACHGGRPGVGVADLEVRSLPPGGLPVDPGSARTA